MALAWVIGLIAFISTNQISSASEANIITSGDHFELDLIQSGDNNTATVESTGNNMTVTGSQTGNNTFDLVIENAGGSVDYTVNQNAAGNSHTATLICTNPNGCSVSVIQN